MRAQLAAAEVANKGFAPYAGTTLTLFAAQPLLDSSGNPVPMFAPADASTPLRTAVSRYNASALDYRTANGWLAEAVAMRDAAAARAAAAIQAALGSDGLQDQTGLWHDITATADAFRTLSRPTRSRWSRRSRIPTGMTSSARGRSR